MRPGRDSPEDDTPEAATAARFAHVRDWVFDLDNTLYPPGLRLFSQIEAKMTAFVMRHVGLPEDEAQALRRLYWRRHGTTLRGLMLNHAIAPDAFLAEVHDIDLSAVAPDPGLARLVGALPGRKIVFTNGSRAHARNVTAALGLQGAFDALYGIEDAGYEPKPAAGAFARVFGAAGIAGPGGAMFEDEARNLAIPHGLGMRTVLIGDGAEEADAPHVEHRSPTLAPFLGLLSAG